MKLYNGGDYSALLQTMSSSGNVTHTGTTSLRINGGCCVNVFDQKGYKGNKKLFCNDEKNLGLFKLNAHTWNDKISSVEIPPPSLNG